MRLKGSALEFRMVLHCHEPGVVMPFNHLDQCAVGGQTGKDQSGGFQLLPVGVVELESVTVPFMHLGGTIGG